MKNENDPKVLEAMYETTRSAKLCGIYFGCSKSTIYRRLNELEIPRLKRIGGGKPPQHPWLNDTFFDVLTPDSAYVLGFIVADGHLRENRNSFQISQKDEGVLREFSRVMKGGQTRKYKGQSVPSLYFSSRHATDVLRSKYKFGPNKSFNIRLPVVERGLYPHLIRGYFDGDGTVKEGAGTFKFTSRSHGLLKDVKKRLELEGINGGSIKGDDLSYHNVLTAIDFGKYIYGEDFEVWGSPLFVERKRERFVKVAKRWRGREWFHEQIAAGISFTDMGAELGIRPSIVSRVSKRM